MTAGPKVRIRGDVETENALVISCFPTVGMVSPIVAAYLIEHLELDYIGGIFDSRLPAVAIVNDGWALPPVRAYGGSPVCSIEGCDQVIVLTSELMINDLIGNELVWALFDWSKEAKIGRGLTVDAFPKAGMKAVGMDGNEPTIEYDDDVEKVDLLGLASNDAMREAVQALGLTMVKRGVLRGMNAAIHGEAHRRGIDVMGIMAEADPRYPDARAAAEIIRCIDQLLPITSLDIEELIEEAESIEEQVSAMMSAAKQDEQGSSGANAMLYG